MAADPTPEHIREMCLLIQSEWTAEEKLRRLRVDLRPTFTTADGRRLEMTEAAYDRHHEGREEP
jgi:hypothetical protein